MSKTWLGEVKLCDICTKPIAVGFVDGRTRMGPWACMCLMCHRSHGVGLGTGKGQQYQRNADGKFEKIAG
jgi:hypothetical protein